ncbi:exostosin-like 3 isoform X2 [Dendronephthya gigantea]|uniref:exostosin-like 3 isoform X2 n=1 Tax=Dendronephthya gigantea TaxID=151771 RepID=UPI00106A14A8|nr:exostosin-like 3 isoform X2 [Dendronephthya gigantea]
MHICCGDCKKLSDFREAGNVSSWFEILASLITSGAAWENSAPQLPAIRKYILSFEGNYHGKTKKLHNKTSSFISVNDLKALGIEAKDIFIKLSCKVDKKFVAYDDWQLCRTHTSRAEVLKASTFTLIYQSESSEDQTPTIIRFIEALQYGAIPVVVSDNIILPFADIIEWERAAILLHSAQFPQLHFIMRTMVINDLLDMRRQGRFLWETYFSTTETVLQTTIAAIQTRLSLPGTPAKETHFSSVFSESSEPLFYRPDANVLIQNGLNSPTYFQNFTSNNMYAKQRWNSYPGALMLYPSDPFVPILPSSAAFKNSSSNMQPIGKGAGGAGVEFQKALGGDYPFEQFTIVMLTYKRESVLIEALGRLEGLQYLSKVVVVWNSPGDPSPDLKWPNIGVPIKVLRPKMNSLNNRFLPFDEIETDAVLSMDDDIHLRHDEILFGFRVWREARDRIVGFPGRYHAWDINYGGWLYNSNYSCELSMVLTGAAFIHKYYTFLYTHVIPQAIRDKVDEYTNCEDIAMNFLVSHVTRKPPLKVTSRWTFRCPDCTSTLFLDETHFTERHKCINFFVKVFGYMPLLRTQFRADSVLFKTRISSDKTKCFTYI